MWYVWAVSPRFKQCLWWRCVVVHCMFGGGGCMFGGGVLERGQRQVRGWLQYQYTIMYIIMHEGQSAA
jgi:hypothetical protein